MMIRKMDEIGSERFRRDLRGKGGGEWPEWLAGSQNKARRAPLRPLGLCAYAAYALQVISTRGGRDRIMDVPCRALCSLLSPLCSLGIDNVIQSSLCHLVSHLLLTHTSRLAPKPGHLVPASVALT